MIEIVDKTITEPFKVYEGVKLNSVNYFVFMDKTEWYNFQPCNFKVKCVFMHNNAPSHMSKVTAEFFGVKGLEERS